MLLTIRTPYKIIAKEITDYSRVIAKTNEAILCVQNRMPAAAHILPPGKLVVRLNNPTEDFSGDLMHMGGFLVIHPDNSCEINLVECIERKEMAPEKLTQSDFENSDGNLYVDKIQKSTYNSFLKQLGN